MNYKHLFKLQYGALRAAHKAARYGNGDGTYNADAWDAYAPTGIKAIDDAVAAAFIRRGTTTVPGKAVYLWRTYRHMFKGAYGDKFWQDKKQNAGFAR